MLADAGEGENGVNLASHFNNVGYELDDVGKRTNVVASMVVPNGMVTPAVTTDLCVGESQTLAEFRGQLLSFDALITVLNVDNIATLRAFVVNRTAPGSLPIIMPTVLLVHETQSSRDSISYLERLFFA